MGRTLENSYLGHQLVIVPALLRAKGVALRGVAKGDNKANRAVEIADGADFFIVKPAEDTGGKSLRGGFGGEVGSGNADIDGAVVVTLYLSAEGGGFDIGLFGNDYLNRSLEGKLIHSHSRCGFSNLQRSVSTANGEMVGLTVTRRRGETGGFQHGMKLIFLDRA